MGDIQFSDRKQFPVSAHKTADGWASPGLSFDDYQKMGTQRRAQSGERRLPTPTWAVNDKFLRQLLVNFLEERAGIRRKKGTLQERLARAQQVIINQRPRLSAVLDKLCRDYVHIKRFGAYADLSDEEVLDIAESIFINRPLLVSDPSGLGAREMLTAKQARDWEIEIEGIDTLLSYTNGPSAGAGTIAAVVYLYYKVGMDSVGVGMELGIKPPHCRQILYRLHQTAEKLWPSHNADSSGASKDADAQKEDSRPSHFIQSNRTPDDVQPVPGLAPPLYALLQSMKDVPHP